MYDFDSVVNRKGTCCIKWEKQTRAFGTEGLLPFWIADTDFPVEPHIKEMLIRRAEHSIYGYACQGDGYMDAVTAWFQTRHHWEIKKEWIIPCSGVVTAIGFAMDAVTKPGDKVMLLTPMYDPFFQVITGSGRTLVTLDLTEQNGTYEIDYEAFENQLKAGVEAVIFCNPHNPIGKVWNKCDLERISKLCAQYHVYILSDDIHCDVVMEGHTYTPIATFDCIKDLTATFTAPSKTFNVAGAGSANIIVENEELRCKIRQSLMSKFLMGPGLFGYVICEAAYTYGERWLDEELVYLNENSRYVTTYLKEHMPLIKACDHQGTFLMWLDFRALTLDSNEICGQLCRECGVALNRGNAFGDSGDGFMRLNIGCSRTLLAELMNRLQAWYEHMTQKLELQIPVFQTTDI